MDSAGSARYEHAGELAGDSGEGASSVNAPPPGGGSVEAKCCKCGSKKVLAKIQGKYYCYKCGSELLREHIARQLRELAERGVVPLEELEESGEGERED